MAHLSPEATALIRAGRGAFRPTPEDRDRALLALRAKLGDGVFDGPPSEAPTGSSGAGRFGARVACMALAQFASTYPRSSHLQHAREAFGTTTVAASHCRTLGMNRVLGVCGARARPGIRVGAPSKGRRAICRRTS